MVEEFVRFRGNDPHMVAELKRFRHELTGTGRLIAASDLLAARDTRGDVGTNISTEQEMNRTDLWDVVTAALKRLQEALRVLEEYAKPLNREAAVRFERLRYNSYGLEQDIVTRWDARMRFAHVRLYVIITSALCNGDWLDTARAAINGGADCLQLREKDIPDGELLRRAEAMVNLCREQSTVSIINDRPDIAAISGADGVHVGQDELPPAATQLVVGAHRIVGFSTHTVEQAKIGGQLNPTYLAIGPMYASDTKMQSHIAGPDTLRQVAREVNHPLVAIGGITLRNLGEVVDAGAQSVCVCGAIISSDNVTSAAQAFKKRLPGVE